MISPNFPASKFDAPSIDDLIDVFEDRLLHWTLEPAKQLIKLEHGQVPAFCICLTYFEGIWAYLSGATTDGRSKASFISGFVEVFSGGSIHPDTLRRIGALLYGDARCGFFHDGLFREHIYFASLSRGEMLVTLPKVNGRIDERGEIQSVLVDSARFFARVETHFQRFVGRLRDVSNTGLRAQFADSFKRQCNWEELGPVIGIPDPERAT
jgi:hypothetical protein